MPLVYFNAIRTLTIFLTASLFGCAPLTLTQERQLGEEFERAVKREVVFFRDDIVVNYVDQLGREILRAAGSQPFEYTFQLIENEEINAFAAPGGRIYMHTGTILKAENVSELIGVIAHEIGHVTSRHIAENYNRGRTVGVGKRAVELAVGILWGSHAAGGADLVGDLAAASYLNNFGRRAEHEADAFAVGVMIKAGYDPEGLVSFFQTLKAESGPKPPTFLSSHPTTDDRIQETQTLIDQAVMQPSLRSTDAGRLQVIQRRIKLRMRTLMPGVEAESERVPSARDSSTEGDGVESQSSEVSRPAPVY